MNSGVQIIRIIIEVLTFAIFIRVILSWFVVNTRNRYVLSAYQVLHQLTEPILAPLRRVVPNIGMIDISPIVAIILLWFIDLLIVSLV